MSDDNKDASRTRATGPTLAGVAAVALQGITRLRRGGHADSLLEADLMADASAAELRAVIGPRSADLTPAERDQFAPLSRLAGRRQGDE
jgi:hypothetical protein